MTGLPFLDLTATVIHSAAERVAVERRSIFRELDQDRVVGDVRTRPVQMRR